MIALAASDRPRRPMAKSTSINGNTRNLGACSSEGLLNALHEGDQNPVARRFSRVIKPNRQPRHMPCSFCSVAARSQWRQLARETWRTSMNKPHERWVRVSGR